MSYNSDRFSIQGIRSLSCVQEAGPLCLGLDRSDNSDNSNPARKSRNGGYSDETEGLYPFHGQQYHQIYKDNETLITCAFLGVCIQRRYSGCSRVPFLKGLVPFRIFERFYLCLSSRHLRNTVDLLMHDYQLAILS